MTTNKPEVVYATNLYSSAPVACLMRRTGEMIEPVIRLSNYEALQDECEQWKNSASSAHQQLTANRIETEKLAVDWSKAMAECEELREYAEFGRSVLSKREPGKKYGCHCDPEEGMEPDECVIDLG